MIAVEGVVVEDLAQLAQRAIIVGAGHRLAALRTDLLKLPGAKNGLMPPEMIEQLVRPSVLFVHVHG
ncbi:hypothetical protein BE61_81570 [Bradyrhizobium elkanii USDA 61]|nr:hypothetical protein BE61_81570 [Bradyrhizobium elkanii USDA 61]